MPAIELGSYLRATEERYHDCIEACAACWVACEMCSDACLDEPQVQELVRCIRLDRDCAGACRMAVAVMVRGSEMAAEVCRLCAVLCDACAEECARHADRHDHCRVCAEACRRCAEECRRMAA
jgi:hypothetical protein